MSIRNRKFSRRNFSTEGAIAGFRQAAHAVNPNPFSTPSANVDGVQASDIEAQMGEMQNHRGGCGDDFAKGGGRG